MAANFSANQYQREFTANRLCNWQVPKWHPSRPRQRTKPTKIISNDRGHLLPGVPRPLSNPWGHFKSTWQMPDKISNKQAFELNAPHVGDSRWAKPAHNRKQINNQDSQEETNNATTTGNVNFTSENQTDLLDQQSNHNIRRDKSHYPASSLGLANSVAPTANQAKSLNNENTEINPDDNMQREVTEKPGEQNTIPLVPANCNFQAARKMHVENLEHQPLPDSIMDRAFRRYQALGATNPEMALNVIPTATGVGVKTHNAGPTHCTKLKVYRPKTCGVVPKPLADGKYALRPLTGGAEKLKLGAMDLAIRWDYRPLDPRDEPRRAAHIDGSDESAGPAVFTVVRTPRTPTADPKTDRSGGVFYSTLGEHNFFNKDLMQQKLPFASKSAPPERTCRCKSQRRSAEKYKKDNQQHFANDEETYQVRQRSLSRPRNAHRKCQRSVSSPNISEICNSKDNYPNHQHKHQTQHTKQHKKVPRLCETQPINDHHTKKLIPIESSEINKQPFKTGIPNSNSSGTCTSFDSGCCSSVSQSSSSESSKSYLKVPKPRHPYAKRDYVIDTLAPPFACWHGGAGQGGYPEHWRLASVYQHAYKPIQQRRRPLLATVYQ